VGLQFCVNNSAHTDIYRIQLAINVQVPVDYGGPGGKAIYIGRHLNQ